MSDNENFLKPLLDLMNQRMDDLNKKIDENTAVTNQTLKQAQYTNGRVTKLELKAADEEAKKAAKHFSMPPGALYLIAVGAVVLLSIIAALLKIPVWKILP